MGLLVISDKAIRFVLWALAEGDLIRDAPKLLAISGGAMRVWVVGFGCGRFNVRRWQKLATSSSLLLWEFTIGDKFLAVDVEPLSGVKGVKSASRKHFSLLTLSHSHG